MLDVLAIGAHPDDCEIMLGGTLCVLQNLSYKVGICDLCSGEAGTYGSGDIRKAELQKASAILNLDARITLDLPDGNIRNTEENRLKLIEVIREQRPETVFGFFNQLIRHPDHYYAGLLVRECVFLAGLEKIRTAHPLHRPSTLLTFKELVIRDKPDFVVDISAHWEQKIAAIRAYASQFSLADEPQSDPKRVAKIKTFWELVESRSRMAGAMIGAPYGETFYSDAAIRLTDIPAAFER